MKKILILCAIFIVLMTASAMAIGLNVTLSDQGSGVKTKTNGIVLASGDINITIWDNLTGGTLVHQEVFTGAIINGSWNVMMGENSSNNLSLEYGKVYYKDYMIGTEDADFTDYAGTTVERQKFNSPLGEIADSDITDSTNLTLSSAITFALGEIIDNVVNGVIQITGILNVSSNISASGTGIAFGGAAGNNQIEVEDTAGNLTITMSDTEAMRINSKGQLGLNTTNPGANYIMEAYGGIRVIGNMEPDSLDVGSDGMTIVNSSDATLLQVNPEGTFLVNEPLKLDNYDGSAAACAGPNAGVIIFNVTDSANTFMGCDGSNWVALA